MKIALDFDGVIGNVGELKSLAARRIFGVTIRPGKFRRELIVEEGLLTEEEYRALQKEIYLSEKFARLMKPVRGVRTYLKKLMSDGHEIAIVSMRSGRSQELAEEWMKNQNLPPIPFIEVGWGKNRSKAPYLHGFDVFIDDDLDRLAPVAGIVPHLFLFSWGYNLDLEEANIATRISSWKEFYQVINELSRTSK